MSFEKCLNIEFETINEQNIDALRTLNNAIFPIRYDDRLYKDVLACGDVTQLAYIASPVPSNICPNSVEEVNRNIVGAIACRLEKHSEGPKLYIASLGVLAPYRSMGAGSKLLRRILVFVSEELPEVTEAYLHVHSANEEAIRFYKRFGFLEDEIIRGYYRRLQPPDAVILRKKLQQN